MTWIVRSTHPESLHDGRMIAPNEEAIGVDPELDKEAIERGVLVQLDDVEEKAAEAPPEPAQGEKRPKRTGSPRPSAAKGSEKTTAEGAGPSTENDGGAHAAPDPAASPQKEDDK